jgi:serine-type D-Ala-D-Ala carboxypeptidase/endopeptidase (penicillin-binding protein 4)
MRWRPAALVATLIVVAGSGATYVVVHGDETGRRVRAVRTPTPEPVRSPALAPPDATAPSPTRSGLAGQLRRAAAAPGLGRGLAALVVDGVTGQPLFVRRPDATLPPASTTKLLTAIAALETLGPDATLTTNVVRSGRTLYLVGGGDVTLAAAARDVYPAPATLTDLAARTASAVAGTRFRVRYDDTRWRGPQTAAGWPPTHVSGGNVSPVSALEVDEGRLTGFTSVHPQPREPDPARAAATAFQAALTSAGVRVSGPVGRARAPKLAPVASISSPPVGALVQRMLTDSDNDLAEALARTTAVHEGRPATFTGAAGAVTTALARSGLPTASTRLFDGSGLSTLDRVTPRLLVSALQLVATRPELRPIATGLPVAGFTGTLADRYRSRPNRDGAGVVRAKTGTLAGVNALAGTVTDADGRLLIFAFLTDRAADPDATEAALDRLAAALADCGCK